MCDTFTFVLLNFDSLLDGLNTIISIKMEIIVILKNSDILSVFY